MKAWTKLLVTTSAVALLAVPLASAATPGQAPKNVTEVKSKLTKSIPAQTDAKLIIVTE